METSNNGRTRKPIVVRVQRPNRRTLITEHSVSEVSGAQAALRQGNRDVLFESQGKIWRGQRDAYVRSSSGPYSSPQIEPQFDGDDEAEQ
jgi:hypothetical protein